MSKTPLVDRMIAKTAEETAGENWPSFGDTPPDEATLRRSDKLLKAAVEQKSEEDPRCPIYTSESGATWLCGVPAECKITNASDNQIAYSCLDHLGEAIRHKHFQSVFVQMLTSSWGDR